MSTNTSSATTQTIDLRSDTVTLPSAAMREAIAHAELGDDVYGEDPTVNRLETLAAERVGKEAAILVVSGTMGNLAALLAHAQRGDRVVLGDESHIYNYEGGGASALGGLVYWPVPTLANGQLEPLALQRALARVDDVHLAQPGVVCLENTHNRCGGTVLPLDYLAEVHAQTQQAGVPLHLDGARLFNAAVALDVAVRDITQHVDTVQFCLSKGLSAPVGSIVAGPRAFIDRVHRVRKMLGGGMRQAGVIAAAGIIALEYMVDRLADDHTHARRLAEGLATIPGLQINLDLVQSDIVRFELAAEHLTSEAFVANLREHGVLMGTMGGRVVRAVTHYGVDATEIDQTVEVVRRVMTAI